MIFLARTFPNREVVSRTGKLWSPGMLTTAIIDADKKISHCETPSSELSVVYLPLQFFSSQHPYFLNFLKQNQRDYVVSQVGTDNCITRQHRCVCQFDFLARLRLPVSLGLTEDTIRDAGWVFETVSGLMFSISRT